MSDPSIVAVRNLTHRYGARTVLDRVTFQIDKPAVFGVLGPNGSGKSTLFRVLATSLTPTAGTAALEGIDLVAEPCRVRARMGIVFQRPSLDDKLTVRENLFHQGHLYGLRGRALRDRAKELLSRLGLADRAADRVSRLSGGLQRRVELAKGLLHRPRLLVLDEPSTGLDPASRAGFMEQLCTLRDEGGVTSLVTTHLMDEAERCDRLAVLDDGHVVGLDTPAALRSAVGGDVVTIATRDPQRMSAALTSRFGGSAVVVGGMVRIERERAHAFIPELLQAFPGEIDSVTVGRPTLEDAFVHWTGRRLSSAPAEASTTPVERGR